MKLFDCFNVISYLACAKDVKSWLWSNANNYVYLPFSPLISFPFCAIFTIVKFSTATLTFAFGFSEAPMVPDSCCGEGDKGVCTGSKIMNGPPSFGPPLMADHEKNPVLYTDVSFGSIISLGNDICFLLLHFKNICLCECKSNDVACFFRNSIERWPNALIHVWTFLANGWFFKCKYFHALKKGTFSQIFRLLSWLFSVFYN